MVNNTSHQTSGQYKCRYSYRDVQPFRLKLDRLMQHWGIKNYTPQWVISFQDLSNILSNNLRCNSKVTSLWSLWDVETDEWFEDAPIVLCTENEQLEFCAVKLEEFSISKNTIDLEAPVYWCDADEADEQPLLWVKEKNPEFQDLPGKRITGVEIVETNLEKDLQTFLGLDAWVISGIKLQLENQHLEILNGLDCNLLSRHRSSDPMLRYSEIKI